MIYFPEKLNSPGLKLSHVGGSVEQALSKGLGRKPGHEQWAPKAFFWPSLSGTDSTLGCLPDRRRRQHSRVSPVGRLINTNILSNRKRWLLTTGICREKKWTILPELDKTVDSKERRKEENMPGDVVASVICPWPAHGDSGFTSSLCGCPLMWPLSCFSFLGLICKRKGHSLWALFLWDAETLFPEGPRMAGCHQGSLAGCRMPEALLISWSPPTARGGLTFLEGIQFPKHAPKVEDRSPRLLKSSYCMRILTLFSHKAKAFSGLRLTQT